MAGTELERAAARAGPQMAREIYADRAYDDTGNLVSRKLAGAVLHDPEEAAARRVSAMVRKERSSALPASASRSRSTRSASTATTRRRWRWRPRQRAARSRGDRDPADGRDDRASASGVRWSTPAPDALSVGRPVGGGKFGRRHCQLPRTQRPKHEEGEAATRKFIAAVTTNTACQLPVDALMQVRERHEKGRGAFGRIEKAQVRGRVFRAEGVGAGGGKEAEDLAPGQKDEAGEDHEGPWRRPRRSEQPIADPAQAERDRHCVLATDMVGNPAEQRPRRPVGDVVDEQRDSQRGTAPKQHVSATL